MKKRLLTFVFAALTVGLLGSCSKINERIDGLDKRVYDLENEKIASVEQQIAIINQSIADLETIRTNIQTLIDAKTAQGEDITALKAADTALEGKITELKTYVDNELANYATTEWANATFATLVQLNSTITELNSLKETVNGLGTSTDSKITALRTDLTTAIDTAISGVNDTITALEARVSALEQMIQTVSILPAYSDGSVKAKNGILTIDCIISPKAAVISLKKENFTVLAGEVLTKSAPYKTLSVTNDEDLVIDKINGTATIKVDITSILPKDESKTLSVALNVKNGISDYTTEFVSTTMAGPKVRVITATFEEPGGNGVTPLWEAGNAICLLSDTDSLIVKFTEENISEDGKTATFTANIEDDFYSVYPASAAAMDKCTDGKVAFSIPAKQDGTFASANISVAKANGNKLLFKSAVAILEFDQTLTTDVRSVRVEAAYGIAGTLTASFEADNTVSIDATGLTRRLINSRPVETAQEKYYVAVAPVLIGDTEVEYQQTINVATVYKESTTLEHHKIYSDYHMDGKTYELKRDQINGHEYTQVGACKWATVNIGAVQASECGHFFTYGNIIGYTFNSTKHRWVVASGYEGEGTSLEGDFCESNYSDPGKSLETDIPEDAQYDAARAHWGSYWRIPTHEEQQRLRNNVYWKGSSGYKVYVPVRKEDVGQKDTNNASYSSGELLYFPWTGVGSEGSADNLKWIDKNQAAFFWSSTITDNKGNAYILYTVSHMVSPASTLDRYRGATIRPVSD